MFLMKNIQLVYLFIGLLGTFFVVASDIYTGSWVIEVSGGSQKAKQVADELDLLYNGQVGSLKDFYFVQHKKHTRLRRGADGLHQQLQAHRLVKSAEQQKLLKRVKRDTKHYYFNDPQYPKQWYIQNQDVVKGRCSLDMSVVPVWKKGITGKNVVVTVVDDGIDYNHPDLKRNYDAKASHDFNGHDDDPYPRYDLSLINKHGTRCAGEVAASADNNVCVSGVAYNAKIGGIRMLDGDVTDAVEGGSLSHNPGHVDIYTNSWGPDDDGRTVDGPAKLAQQAFENGVKNGRNGLGSIFVWATGNGGRQKDYCSCDGYINRIETIAIGAVDHCGDVPYYAEACPGTLAVTYSSGGGYDKKIATTDLHKRCTTAHTGTSAASPLAAGILALALEVNPNITWRDMQHLIVKSSTVLDRPDSSLTTNGAGYRVSTYRGFGVLNASRLVEMASDEDWQTAGGQHVCQTENLVLNKPVHPKNAFESNITTNACANDRTQRVCKLEHVKLYLSITSYPRGGLEIYLTSPSGTVSPILKQRRYDNGNNFSNWGFLSVYFWDENPTGMWKLKVIQTQSRGGARHTIKNWRLQFYGTNCDGNGNTNNSIPTTKSSFTTTDETSNNTNNDTNSKNSNVSTQRPVTMTPATNDNNITYPTVNTTFTTNNTATKTRIKATDSSNSSATTSKQSKPSVARTGATTTSTTTASTTTVKTTETAQSEKDSKLKQKNHGTHGVSILTGALIGAVTLIFILGILVLFRKSYWKLKWRWCNKELEVKTFDQENEKGSLLAEEVYDVEGIVIEDLRHSALLVDSK